MCGIRRVTGDVGLLVCVRHILIPDERADSDNDRHVGRDDDLVDNCNSIDDDHLDTFADNRFAHDHVDEHLDHHDRGSIVGHRDSCHRPVGARTRHHGVSHG